MEPKTHDDIWKHYLGFDKSGLAAKMPVLAGLNTGVPAADLLKMNAQYAAAMARCFFSRSPDPLPAAGDVKAMAQLWKDSYNSESGAGTVDEFMANWKTFKADAAF